MDNQQKSVPKLMENGLKNEDGNLMHFLSILASFGEPRGSFFPSFLHVFFDHFLASPPGCIFIDFGSIFGSVLGMNLVDFLNESIF